MLLSRQKPDGGFGLWKVDETHDWPYVSLQVIRALLLARDKDLAVPDETLASCKNYLRTIDKHLGKDSRAAMSLSIRSYALFLRYLNKDSDAKAAARLIREAVAATRKGATKSALSARALQEVPIDTIKEAMPLECAGWLLPIVAHDKQSATEAALLQRLIASQVRETASTASMEAHGYGPLNYFMFYSPHRANAVILESLILAQPDNDLIPKLAKGLLASRIAGKWEGTQENSYSLLALERYFSRYEKNKPDFDAQLWLGDAFLGNSKFAGRTTQTNKLAVPMEFIANKVKGAQQLIINKVGSGRCYYRIGLEYCPKKLSLDAADYGFAVHRTYEGVDNSSDVQLDRNGNYHFKSGSAVRVKIAFSASGERHHVALMDPLPAGTEPVNQELGGSRLMYKTDNQEKHDSDTETESPNLPSLPLEPAWIRALPAPTFGLRPPMVLPPPPPPMPYAPNFGELQLTPWWTWSWYEHQNLRDSQAEAFTSLLNGGSYTYTYLIRATTPGDYIVPPCKAEEMYAPETFGRTATDHVIVE